METKNMPGSRMSFVDRYNSKEATSVFIDDERVASIAKAYDKNLKRIVYRSFDLHGIEIFPPNANLDQIKEQFKKQEIAYCEEIDIRELAESMGYERRCAETFPKEKSRVKKLQVISKGKTKSRSRTR